jgi:1-acyl-sn-glycerol-3-phosphate acyltransferase
LSALRVTDPVILSPMNQKISVSKLKIFVSLSLLIVWTLAIVLVFVIAKAIRPALAHRLIPIFHKGALKCFNLECVVEGTPFTQRPTLYISNHISYIDIFVLGSVLPGTYIAKSEVAKWPLFGQLAKLQNTLFIERRNHKVGGQIEQIRRHLLEKSNLILFPEGTSSTGVDVAPFHSSFFQAAESEETEITIQPVTIAYTHYKNERMNRSARDYYAWYRPRKILPHFLNGLGLGPARVQISCHPTVKLGSFDSRKECCKHCEETIRQGLLHALGPAAAAQGD